MKNFVEYLNEGMADKDMVRDLLLQTWNTEEIVKMIEGTIKSMLKKDPSTISVERLAKSSVMQKICTAAVKAEGLSNVDSATRKQFYQELAEEMVERMGDFK